jgi:transposase
MITSGAYGIPTEAVVAHVLVAKYADHTPLYRQAQIYARQDITLDRSTLTDWVGRAAFALQPVHARLLKNLKQPTKLFADENAAPVLDPGRGRTKKRHTRDVVSVLVHAVCERPP